MMQDDGCSNVNCASTATSMLRAMPALLDIGSDGVLIGALMHGRPADQARPSADRCGKAQVPECRCDARLNL